MSCIFCNYDKNEYIVENDVAFAIYDKLPINKGHVLIIPKKHYNNLFHVLDEEIIKIYSLIHKVKEILDMKYNPDGYNIGVDVGEYGR